MNDNKRLSSQTKKHLYLILSCMLIIALIGIIYREIQFLHLKETTKRHAILSVATVKATPSPITQNIVYPGYVSAWHDATIYARTNGYIKEWKADIGTRVKTGDLLALITAPEVDAQLQQTEADLKNAEANYQLAKSTEKRWLNLLKTDSVSKQETDEKVSDAKAKAAIVAATRASRDRLRDLVSFQRVTAPFDGIVAARNTDVGRLINAGSSAPQPLFRIVQSNRLRIYVRIPQNMAAQITPNITAQLHFSEHPGKIYTAKLLDTANAIDPHTRTLLIQLVIDNANYELLPGSYAQVHLAIPTPKYSVRLPINTLLFRADGLQVGTIDGDHKVVLKPITISRDFGDYIEINTGIKPYETVIINPPDSLANGQEVQISKAEDKSEENLLS